MEKRTRWLISLTLLATILFGPDLYQLTRLTIQEHRGQKRLEGLDAERERLEEEQRLLESDETYVEDKIRATFKYARPGELVVPIDHSQ